MDNKTIMQYFEWYLPNDGLFWNSCAAQAEDIKKSGIDVVWLPPAYKGATGRKSVGYDVYDTYDLGEFRQKGAVRTKYGTKEEYLAAVKAFKDNGVEVYTDIVLNHMMGADELENVTVEATAPTNREKVISGKFDIRTWTKFDFKGRNGKYSDFKWNHTHFSGSDWDEKRKRKGIYRFYGKQWDKQTDSENVNYDYLMGVDLDFDNEETVKAVTDWGKWYYDTVQMDGFRLDAVKHIGIDFYRNWLKEMRTYTGKEMFAVGEYWSAELPKLIHYLDVAENSLSLFDVPLHYAMYEAATAVSSSGKKADLSKLFDETLVKERPANAVTFVDNHDTQPGQALVSFIPEWFKQTAYALILLRRDGVPCVFYGDYFGIPHDNIAPVSGLKELLAVRKNYAYGEQKDYFDEPSVVGFTRKGDSEHENSGVAVILTNDVAGKKRMNVGKAFAGEHFYDILGNVKENVVIDKNGFGVFKAAENSVSVWVRKAAYEDISVNE